MKMKAVAAICRRTKYVALYDLAVGKNMTAQYVAVGHAVYPIAGLPELGENGLLTIFDVPSKDRDNWMVDRRDFPTDTYSAGDVVENEKLLERLSIKLTNAAGTYIPVKTSDGVVFLNEDYFAPLKDISEPLELYERRTPDGNLYVVVKAGMMLEAIILPEVDFVSPTLAEDVSWLSMQCSLALLPAQKGESSK